MKPSAKLRLTAIVAFPVCVDQLVVELSVREMEVQCCLADTSGLSRCSVAQRKPQYVIIGGYESGLFSLGYPSLLN